MCSIYFIRHPNDSESKIYPAQAVYCILGKLAIIICKRKKNRFKYIKTAQVSIKVKVIDKFIFNVSCTASTVSQLLSLPVNVVLPYMLTFGCKTSFTATVENRTYIFNNFCNLQSIIRSDVFIENFFMYKHLIVLFKNKNSSSK